MHFVLGLLLSLVPCAVAADPFAGVSVATASAAPEVSGARRFFTDNFGFRKELMLQYGRVDRAGARQSRQRVPPRRG